MVNREKAGMLLRAIRNELAQGTKHYNRAGEELTTVKAILTTLLDEGEITFQPPPKYNPMSSKPTPSPDPDCEPIPKVK